MSGRSATPRAGPIHDVVVDQRERMHQLERAERGQHRIDRFLRAHDAAPTPICEPRAQPLAAGEDHVTSRPGEVAELRIDRLQLSDLTG